MKIERLSPTRVRVELSERNLRTLLNKLKREDSFRTLESYDPGESDGDELLVQVTAVRDSEHYRDREPGPVHPDDEPNDRSSG